MISTIPCREKRHSQDLSLDSSINFWINKNNTLPVWTTRLLLAFTTTAPTLPFLSIMECPLYNDLLRMVWNLREQDIPFSTGESWKKLGMPSPGNLKWEFQGRRGSTPTVPCIFLTGIDIDPDCFHEDFKLFLFYTIWGGKSVHTLAAFCVLL